MRSPLPLASLLALLAAGLGCDFDGAWEAWCAREPGECHSDASDDAGVDVDAGVTRQCEATSGCAQGQDCVGLKGGGSACAIVCDGAAGSCGALLDCKLVVAVDGTTHVPVCLPFGTNEGACTAVEQCAQGRTCITTPSGDLSCTETCNPHDTICAKSGLNCTYGLTGVPANWGYCL